MLPATAEKDDASNEYAVGYGKPPQASRFRKGQSGNPKGRPPGARGLTTLARKVLDAKLLVRTARGEEYLPRIEIGLLKLVEKGQQGGYPRDHADDQPLPVDLSRIYPRGNNARACLA